MNEWMNELNEWMPEGMKEWINEGKEFMEYESNNQWWCNWYG